MKQAMNTRELITVTGLVQGVGFRPFVYRLALRHHLGGYACNTPVGVVIELEGNHSGLDCFMRDLVLEVPPLAHIGGCTRRIVGESRERFFSGFEIRESRNNGQCSVRISSDISVCDDCIEEMFDPSNRRYLYPFINCTNCGPRFTIIQSLPYDRRTTTMAYFRMCETCRHEYKDALNRRFHAEPVACPVCGPRVWLTDNHGCSLDGDPVVTAIELLGRGKIVAIKGIGGFHLAIDARNNSAVERLRERKRRKEKPFALMTGSPASAETIVRLSGDERRLLMSRERPVVLAEQLPDSGIAVTVAPGIDMLGVMLPYTPLHYLLFYHPGAGGDYHADSPVFKALVMTSGNVSDEPIVCENEEALDKLGGIADAFLFNNRDIHVRCDDSVVRSEHGVVSFVRRSRGYTPLPVSLKDSSPAILALGGEQKNTFCLMEGGQAHMSQHLGDIEHAGTYNAYCEAVWHLRKLVSIDPVIVACDQHPGYFSSRYLKEAFESSASDDVTVVEVQHHHAHIAGVLAEHDHAGPVIGMAMDGSGYGSDGTIWGGEFLLCTAEAFVRAGHIGYVPLPGGSAAIRQLWRMAFSYIRAAYGAAWNSIDLPCLRNIPYEKMSVLDDACAAGLNAPPTSSLGRLFDAVSAILGVCCDASYEGHAAMLLETVARGGRNAGVLPYSIREEEGDNPPVSPVIRGRKHNNTYLQLQRMNIGLILDFRPAIRSLVEGMIAGKPPQDLAAAFHNTVALTFADMAERIREMTGVATVAYSGGCWQNRLLCGLVREILIKRGFTVITNRSVPVNDGGLALGQAWAAAAILRSKPSVEAEKVCVLQSR